MIPFARYKYGREMLVDAGWIRDYPGTFVLSDTPHQLGFHEILLITRGRGRLWLRGVPHELAAGRVFLTGPGETRRWQATGVDGRCLFFTAEFLNGFFTDPEFLAGLRGFRAGYPMPVATIPAADAAWFRERLDSIEEEIAALRDDSHHLLRARLYELLVWLDRRLPAAADVALPGPTGIGHIDRFVALVARRASERLSVASAAAELGISAGHLNDLCRRHLHQSAGRLIRHHLLIEARRRLRYDDAPAARIAADLGFEDPSYFTRFFTRETGTTPTAYRASIRGKHQ